MRFEGISGTSSNSESQHSARAENVNNGLGYMQSGPWPSMAALASNFIPTPASKSSSSLLSKIGPDLAVPITESQHGITECQQGRETLQRRQPPPVNRAAKPTVKPAAKFGAEPDNFLPIPSNAMAGTQLKVSPFSTPPSSDEDTFITKPGKATHISRGDLHPHGEESVNGRKNSPSKDSGIGNRETKPEDYKSRSSGKNRGTLDLATGSSKPQTSASLPQREAATATTQSNAKTVQPETSHFPPPPKRSIGHHQGNVSRRVQASQPAPQASDTRDEDFALQTNGRTDHSRPSLSEATLPSISNLNRRAPVSSDGTQSIGIGHEFRVMGMSNSYICTAGSYAWVWDVRTGDLLFEIPPPDREVKFTAIMSLQSAQEGNHPPMFWLGTSDGQLEELDASTSSISESYRGAHDRKEVTDLFQHEDSFLSMDIGGKLCKWAAREKLWPDLRHLPETFQLSKKCGFPIIVRGSLWVALGKGIQIFTLHTGGNFDLDLLYESDGPAKAGLITSRAIIGGQDGRIFFGHSDGKVSSYSSETFQLLQIINIHVYKINSLLGVGSVIWAAFSTGEISVLDPATGKWHMQKLWVAHDGFPAQQLAVDGSHFRRTGVLRVASAGGDGYLRIWDGTLFEDRLERCIEDSDVEFCTFREISALVVTWNAAAMTPGHIQRGSPDATFFHRLLAESNTPDFLVFGFQELVDLDDKKLTAKTLLKGSVKREPAMQEHMSHHYRAWRDYLQLCIEATLVQGATYHLLHATTMVGLFSCIFVKDTERHRVKSLRSAEIKRGIGGLHGNKGALMIRFILDSTSICLINCHLAAGQTQTTSRNNDLNAILETSVFPVERDNAIQDHCFRGGGDGSKIGDHEITILNGDLNYRIDTMGRDAIIRAIKSNHLDKLLERDQLLVSRRRNPLLAVRSLTELPITFAPTYKYDFGVERYDTSDKQRAPAWCDRILFQGHGKITQTNYARHQFVLSDHRPVTGSFRLRVKSVDPLKREKTMIDCRRKVENFVSSLRAEAKSLEK